MGSFADLIANYKWVLIVVVLVIMLIIGYIADSTDFGHKKPGRSQKPIDDPNKVEKETEEKLTKISEIKDEDLETPLVDKFSMPESDMQNDIDPSLYAPLTDSIGEVKKVIEPEVAPEPLKEETLVSSIEPANVEAGSKYEEKLVPEIIAEQYGKDEISSDDDIWNF